MTTNKRVILAGDMNSHAGTDRSGVERWHGNHGYDSPNDEGSTILRCTRCVIWQSSQPPSSPFPPYLPPSCPSALPPSLARSLPTKGVWGDLTPCTSVGKPRTGLFPNMQLTILYGLTKLINESIPRSADK